MSNFQNLRDGLTAMLGGLTRLALGLPALTVVLFITLTGVSLWFTASHVRINTSNTDMLSAELPFRQNAIAFTNAFPALSENLVIVLDAATADSAEDSARRLSDALSTRDDLFEWVFYDRANDFLRRNGLLYLDLPDLERVADDLAAAQPLLAKLNAEPNFAGLAGVFELAVNEGDEAARASLAPAVNRFAEVIESVGTDTERPLSWTALLGDMESDGGERQIILARPKLDFSSLSPAGEAIDRIRAAVDELSFDPAHDVRVGITGSAALEQEELASVSDGMGLVGLISATLVLVLLFLAYRSVVAVAATLIVLVCGLCLTAGLATIVVGQFNLISVAFAVLFIGLGVDFNLHYTLRAMEEGAPGSREALDTSTRQGGGALVLCAVSSSVAFFSFSPTEYRGVAELGIIAGMGMMVALLLSLTMLPAMLSLLKPRSSRVAGSGGLVSPVVGFAIRNHRTVLAAAGMLSILSAFTLPALTFDDDPMNLRDPEAQSVQVARELMNDPERQRYSIDALLPADADIASLRNRLTMLETVDRVRTAADLVPDDLEEKLYIVEDLGFFLGPMAAQQGTADPLDPDRRQEEARRIRDLVSGAGDDFGAAGARLVAALDRILGDDTALARAETLLVSGLHGRLGAIFDALGAEAFGPDDLPGLLRDFWIAADGQVRMEIVPSGDMSDAAERDRFVHEVTDVLPDATGTPVIIDAAGNAVVVAFFQALATAAAAVVILLVIMLRNGVDVMIVCIPAVVGSLLTGGTMWLTGLSFNFANIIVLPLLFGLSVDFGIHMVMRARDGDLENLYRVSTMRAILYSAATTVGSFAALSMSPHTGTASMGFLLTIALAATILATLVVTPALLCLKRG